MSTLLISKPTVIPVKLTALKLHDGVIPGVDII